MEDSAYTERLIRLQDQKWKQRLAFANPYALHIRHVVEGTTLEVGCGIGRVLNFLPQRMVGVDRNAESVQVCRSRGLAAFTPDEFFSRYAGQRCFNTLLLSHVVEHMTVADAGAVLRMYTPFLAPGARLVLIAPQEKGFASDSTHVEFMDYPKLAQIAAAAGFTVDKHYSFPFPRAMGQRFIYNEFVLLARAPAA